MDAHEEMDLIGFPAAFNEGATPIRENLPEGSRKASRIWGVKTYRRHLVTKTICNRSAHTACDADIISWCSS